MLQLSPRENGDEDGADAYWAEMACKEGLAPVFDVWYERLEQHHDGDAAEQDDKDGDDDEAPDLHAQEAVVVLLPRDNGAKVNKVCQVEKQVDNVGNVRLLRLFAKPAVVREADSGSKAHEEIVYAEDTTRTGAEEREGKVKDEETLAINHVVLLGVADAAARNVADHEAVEGAKDALVEDDIDDKVEADVAGVAVVLDQVEREVDEGKGHAVVAARLGRQQISQMLGHALGEFALANHGRGQDGIGGGDTGGDNEGFEPVKRRNHPPDEEADEKPANGHDGHQQEDDGAPVLLHVKLGQFDADGKTLDDENDARELDGDDINAAPGPRVDEIGGMGSEDDAAEGGDGGLANVHALLDNGRAQHEERGEAAEDNVDQVRLGDVEVVPRHGGGRLRVSRRGGRGSAAAVFESVLFVSQPK